MKDLVGVVGAGTMGAGIAQIAAVAQHPVYLYDAAPGAAERSVAAVRARLVSLAEKGRLDIDPATVDLRAVSTLADLAPCRVVIEAIVEDLAIKQSLFTALEEFVEADCVLASNTSSLSPTALAAVLRQPERFVGLHFFNPVPLMRLVEVVAGLGTDPAIAERVSDLAKSWGKTVVRSAPTPGFIVNRVARPYYAQAWRLFEERVADIPTIDAVLTGAGGFRMGPFALMDLIGHDVNDAVTRAVWTSFGFDPRFAPSLAQRGYVEAGWYGRKSGRGVYDYHDGAELPTPAPAPATSAPLEVTVSSSSALGPLLERAAESGVSALYRESDRDSIQLASSALIVQCDGRTAADLAARYGHPVIVVDRVLDPATATAIAIAVSEDCKPSDLDAATGLLQAAGLAVYLIEDAPGLVVTRTVAMLVNLAADAVAQGVASDVDVDIAMTLGTNYPLGPLEWGRRWGLASVLGILDALETYYRDGHYRACALLRRSASSRRQLT